MEDIGEDRVIDEARLLPSVDLFVVVRASRDIDLRRGSGPSMAQVPAAAVVVSLANSKPMGRVVEVVMLQTEGFF